MVAAVQAAVGGDQRRSVGPHPGGLRARMRRALAVFRAGARQALRLGLGGQAPPRRVAREARTGDLVDSRRRSSSGRRPRSRAARTPPVPHASSSPAPCPWSARSRTPSPSACARRSGPCTARRGRRRRSAAPRGARYTGSRPSWPQRFRRLRPRSTRGRRRPTPRDEPIPPSAEPPLPGPTSLRRRTVD